MTRTHGPFLPRDSLWSASYPHLNTKKMWQKVKHIKTNIGWMKLEECGLWPLAYFRCYAAQVYPENLADWEFSLIYYTQLTFFLFVPLLFHFPQQHSPLNHTSGCPVSCVVFLRLTYNCPFVLRNKIAKQHLKRDKSCYSRVRWGKGLTVDLKGQVKMSLNLRSPWVVHGDESWCVAGDVNEFSSSHFSFCPEIICPQ